MLGPGALHLIVARKLAARGCGFRACDRVASGGRKANRRFLIDPGQAQHRPGNSVLLVGRQIADSASSLRNRMREMLEVLVAMGQAQQIEGGRFVA